MLTRPRALVLTAAAAAVALIGAFPNSPAAAGEPAVTVGSGDTLSQIALEQGVSVEEIVSLNGLDDANRIFIGQTLRMVPEEASVALPGSVGVMPAQLHTVQPGENLTWIATRYGTTVEALASLNALADPGRIYAGQQLATSPAAAVAPAASPAAEAVPQSASLGQHRVAPGENLTWIAASYGTTVAEIVAANGIANPSFVRAGDVLQIPTLAAPVTTAAVVETATAPPAPSMPTAMADVAAARSDVGRLIIEEAAQYGVPPAFAMAVAWQESGWQQSVVSHAGAVGVMQLLPATADWVSQAMLGEPVNLDDARSNVRAGVRLLSYYLGYYGGDRALVLAAYYQGQSATDRHGIYPASRPYIASILTLEEIFGG